MIHKLKTKFFSIFAATYCRCGCEAEMKFRTMQSAVDAFKGAREKGSSTITDDTGKRYFGIDVNRGFELERGKRYRDLAE